MKENSKTGHIGVRFRIMYLLLQLKQQSQYRYTNSTFANIFLTVMPCNALKFFQTSFKHIFLIIQARKIRISDDLKWKGRPLRYERDAVIFTLYGRCYNSGANTTADKKKSKKLVPFALFISSSHSDAEKIYSEFKSCIQSGYLHLLS